MSISIIIPNFNGKLLIQKNFSKLLDSLREYKESKEIIFVDDASTDGSLEYLKSLKEKDIKISVLENKKNLGFSSSVNKGVDAAKGEIVILLNSDVSPEKNFIHPLLEHFKDDKVFGVGAMDKSIEENKVVLRGRGLGTWKNGFLIHRRGEVDKTNTLWVSGGSSAFKKSIWETLGGLNELYNPFYYEDIDLSYRALKSGYKVLFEPKSIVVHEHEKGSIKENYSENKVRTIAYRNQFILVWENATDYQLLFLHFWYLPYHFVKAILRLDLAFLIGFFKALYLIPKIVKSRRKYKKPFIKKDLEVVREYL